MQQSYYSQNKKKRVPNSQHLDQNEDGFVKLQSSQEFSGRFSQAMQPGQEEEQKHT